MAEEETAAEVAFFRMQQQAMNKEVQMQNELGSEEIQIESSEDEYDPEKDMQTLPFDRRDSLDDSHDPSLLQVSHQPEKDGSFNPSHSSMYNIKQKSASPVPASDVVDFPSAHTRASQRSTPEKSQAANGTSQRKAKTGSSSPLQSPPSRDEIPRTEADALLASSEIPSTTVTVATSSEFVSQTTSPPEKSSAASKPSNIQTVESAPQEKETASTPLSATLPRARLPHDKVGMLEDRIKEDPRGDIDAWISLITEHRKRGKLDDARKVYERFFVVFPSAVSRLWLFGYYKLTVL